MRIHHACATVRTDVDATLPTGKKPRERRRRGQQSRVSPDPGPGVVSSGERVECDHNDSGRGDLVTVDDQPIGHAENRRDDDQAGARFCANGISSVGGDTCAKHVVKFIG